MLDLSGFWAPRQERSVSNADRRDLLEMMAGQAAYFDRVYSESETDLSRAEFVADALANVPMFSGFTPEELETAANPLVALVCTLFGEGAEALTELDPDTIFGWLSDLEDVARRRGGAAEVAVRARVARAELVESDLGTTGFQPDVALVVLLRLRELVRLLDELLVATIRRGAWLELLAMLLAEAFSAEETEQGERPAVPEHGPPPLVLLSAVQPHAPPGRFFSAPRGESVEMRLSQAKEGLMAA